MYCPAVRRALPLLVLIVASAAHAQPPSPDEARAAAEQECITHAPSCNWVKTFAPLERQSVERALAARGYELEPEPWGKVIAHVRVYNEEVFAEDNWLQFFNLFHYTTRQQAIRDELTIQAGDVWDDDLVAESARRLRDPLYSSVIALMPVKSTEPGKIDLLVVTRDVWSIRLNTNYTIQQGALTNLSLALSENNFLGYRNVFAAALTMDQGSLAMGPLFIDKNMFGTHLSLSVRVDEIIRRQSLSIITPTGGAVPTGDPKGIQDGGKFSPEGSDSTISLSRPLWSLASEWGGGASFSHRYDISRTYLGTGLRGYDDPNTPNDDLLPREYELKVWQVNANVVRQWGSTIKQQLAFGQTVISQHPSVLPTFTGDAMQRADFIADVLPRNEVVSEPYVSYTLFTPRYEVVRNLQTYDLAEDLQLGPAMTVTFAQALKVLGSTFNFQRPSASAGWTFPWCRDGFINPYGSISLRIQDGRTIDSTAGLAMHVATPSTRYGRVVAQLNLDTLWHDTQNSYYTIGSDSGLRGYAIGEFFGDRRVSGRFEGRSVPFQLWVLRVGGVAFYEVGGAANSLAQMRLYNDIGIGLRVLIPQTSRQLFRFDLAFPLQASPGYPAWVPHPVLSYDQAF